MRLTAIREDNVVIVDGLARKVTFSDRLPPNWRAVQWYGNVGELEEPGRNTPLNTPDLATILKTAWDNGLPLGIETEPAENDVVAEARARMLDMLIDEEAKRPDADDIFKQAAAEIARQRGAAPRG